MSAAVAAAAAAACVSSSSNSNSNTTATTYHHRHQSPYPNYNHRSIQFIRNHQLYRRNNYISHPPASSRYESQKRHDWNTFLQYLKNQYRPPLAISRCTAVHVLEFLEYLDDQFGETKVHTQNCQFYGQRHSPPEQPCPCPLRQPWSSLDALIGRLRAAFEENGGRQPPEMNPFGSPVVRLYLRELRDAQAKARGV